MKGYKIFGPDYKCNGHKYSIDSPNIYLGEIIAGKCGFHFCPKPIDCIKYYEYTPLNTYAMVEATGNYIANSDKVVTDTLTIVKTLSYEEFGDLLTVNIDTPRLKCSYIRGKLHGQRISKYENGNMITDATYHYGDMRKYAYYLLDGSKNREYEMVNGKIQGVFRKWHKNGQLDTESNYRDGLLHGEYKEYREDGKLYIHCNYTDDKLEGEFKEWNESGLLVQECNYSNGKLNGNYKSWGNKGDLQTECEYKDGVDLKSLR